MQRNQAERKPRIKARLVRPWVRRRPNFSPGNILERVLDIFGEDPNEEEIEEVLLMKVAEKGR